MELLEDGDFEHATEPLAEAARREPEKTSVREALGRAYYRGGAFASPRSSSAPWSTPTPSTITRTSASDGRWP